MIWRSLTAAGGFPQSRSAYKESATLLEEIMLLKAEYLDAFLEHYFKHEVITATWLITLRSGEHPQTKNHSNADNMAMI